MSKTDAPSDRRSDPQGAARRDFLARFFHDLATPLSAVSLHLEGADRRVRRGQDPTEPLGIAREELSRAFVLYEQARELLLSEPGLEESFPFDALVAETAARADGQIRVEGRTGSRVKGDRRALSDALAALLANALEASDASAVAVRVEKSEARVRARVANPGRFSGEPESLFSPRVAGKGKKWGMGLPSARLHAVAAGGTVSIRQEEDRVVSTLELPEETA